MIDDDRASARRRSRARRARGREAAEARGERVAAFSVEEFEAHHAEGRPGEGKAEPIPVEVEVVLVEPGSDSGDTGPGERTSASAEDGVTPKDPALDDDPAGRDVVHFDDPAEMLPALARVAADLWVRAAIWGVEASLRTGARIARAAVDPEAAADLYQDLSGGVRAYAREFLGITELDDQLSELKPLAGATLPQNGSDPEIALRERGAQLLRQAADVSFEDGVHPAYARILTELAPDEARILRTLATDGPQPMVDIREANLIGMGSQLIRTDLNMIAAQAGLRYRDRVEAYLGNLLRLGLIELSDAAVEDAIAYQVLEAQPDVLSTIKETPRAKTVHRSIRLTPFGLGFCQVCLPLESPASPEADPTPTRGADLA
ncbi:MAG TPA: Abi-alpha family protein [Solirubrobacteraceae bacterium]|nr:Abi-alpha family protein [Solirubrobacteraceae bacterium]